MQRPHWLLLAALLLLLAGCARPPCPECPLCPPPPPPLADPCLPESVELERPEPERLAPVTPAVLVPVAWSEVEGWGQDDPAEALGAFRQSCRSLRSKPGWEELCGELEGLAEPRGAELRRWLETRLQPHRVETAAGNADGLVTGYYVPDLRGSRQPSATFPHPLYRRPDDLLVVELRDLYPALGSFRLRGRLEGQRVRPYWDRAAIDGAARPLAGQELLWVEDPVELFFLQIQGSGRISLGDGSRVMVNYAEQNGHPYRSIGAWLLERGAMSRDQMSMQNIKAWAKANPQLVGELLAQNPSYVFFRELPAEVASPPGALGVPLTAGRSLAIDPRHVPLGAPVFVATTWPNSQRPLQRLMLAQDTGGAIKGEVRADFFWGIGDEAGAQAGRMKQPLRMWVLQPLPKEPAAGK